MPFSQCYNCRISLEGTCAGLTQEGEWLCMKCLCEYLGVTAPERGH